MLIYKRRTEKSTGMLLEGGARSRSTPTYLQQRDASRVEDYELKERKKTRLFNGWPLYLASFIVTAASG